MFLLYMSVCVCVYEIGIILYIFLFISIIFHDTDIFCEIQDPHMVGLVTERFASTERFKVIYLPAVCWR